ncbi:PadR family transcriptional regulator [Sphingomonas azotifigens]|uniref:PadR family transcriptional regulator n=1 Tax=Sphingomonas azotifigens TaxID=330920 RepID=UPI00143026B5|nr:PadR family transcriptional regulator [Sphingomonas azotifigens]
MGRNRRPSKQMLRLLEALAVHPQQWRHGYDLMKETGLLSGTLYPLLMRMTDQGLVEAEWHPPEQLGRPARHAYRLTAAGVAFAQTAAPLPPLPITRTALA